MLEKQQECPTADESIDVTLLESIDARHGTPSRDNNVNNKDFLVN